MLSIRPPIKSLTTEKSVGLKNKNIQNMCAFKIDMFPRSIELYEELFDKTSMIFYTSDR